MKLQNGGNKKYKERTGMSIRLIAVDLDGTFLKKAFYFPENCGIIGNSNDADGAGGAEGPAGHRASSIFRPDKGRAGGAVGADRGMPGG